MLRHSTAKEAAALDRIGLNNDIDQAALDRLYSAMTAAMIRNGAPPYGHLLLMGRSGVIRSASHQVDNRLPHVP
jgi:hypothetical protein